VTGRIDKSACDRGTVYRLVARTFPLAVYDGEVFVGLREKFGRLRLAVEHHVDDGPPFGTASPVEVLGRIADLDLARLVTDPTDPDRAGENTALAARLAEFERALDARNPR
jgi:hypothetical protein